MKEFWPDRRAEIIKSLERALELMRQDLAQYHPQSLDKEGRTPRIAQLDDQKIYPILAKKAADIYAGRRARENVFDGLKLFAEPAWDILLDLFVAAVESRIISVTSIALASAVPLSTAMRWIQLLAAEGIIKQMADPGDGSRILIELTNSGFETVAKAVAVA